ncbi:MAG: hypothetical protein H6597_04455 [Flavobacteriales bacterium]|nr:hypothetical protein [Flavobacteriales bacterium]MCB9193764.1 hypothetical protein [Flavobacteriales bacterium]
MTRSQLRGICLPALLALCACGPHRPDHEAPLPDAPLPAAVRPYLDLVGSWVDTTTSDHLDFHEQWVHAGGAGLIGHGYVLSGNDTVFIEDLALGWSDNGNATYSARIRSQNKGKWVPFRGRAHGDTLIFTNPTHDFPKRIAYIRVPSGWSVRVSGRESAGPRTERFELQRAPGHDM